MINCGMVVALGTDFNPNAHCLSMPMVMHLACVNLRMTLNEVKVWTRYVWENAFWELLWDADDDHITVQVNAQKIILRSNAQNTQSWCFDYFPRPFLLPEVSLKVYCWVITCLGHPALITCLTKYTRNQTQNTQEIKHKIKKKSNTKYKETKLNRLWLPPPSTLLRA